MKLTDHLRAALAGDPDRRRLYWLCVRCSSLTDAEHATLTKLLSQCQSCADDGWATPDERTLIRTIFNLHRGTHRSEESVGRSGVASTTGRPRRRGARSL